MSLAEDLAERLMHTQRDIEIARCTLRGIRYPAHVPFGDGERTEANLLAIAAVNFLRERGVEVPHDT